MDQIKRIDHWPEPATLARIEQQQTANGGFAFNLLSDLAALDPSCPLFGAGLIGDDANGRFIRERCRRLKIDDRRLRSTAESPTGFTDVMTETGSGRRTFFYCPGANEQLTENHLRPLESPAKMFCLGYLGFLPLLDAVDTRGLNDSARLLKDARAAGMLTAADLVSARNPNLRAQIAPCLPHLDILFLNEWEAGQLLNRNTSEPFSAGQAKALAQAVRKLGVRGTVVLHFPEGVVAAVSRERMSDARLGAPATGGNPRHRGGWRRPGGGRLVGAASRNVLAGSVEARRLCGRRLFEIALRFGRRVAVETVPGAGTPIRFQ